MAVTSKPRYHNFISRIMIMFNAVCMTAALELSRWSGIKSRQSLLYRRPQPVISLTHTHTYIRPVWEHAAYLPRLVECGITFHVAMILRTALRRRHPFLKLTISFPEYLHGQRLCFLFCGHVTGLNHSDMCCGLQSQSEGEVVELKRDWHGV